MKSWAMKAWKRSVFAVLCLEVLATHGVARAQATLPQTEPAVQSQTPNAPSKGETVRREPSPGAPQPLPSTSPSSSLAKSDSFPVAAPELQEPNHLRALTEELMIVGLGLGYYYTWKDLNSQDWEFDYNWPSLRDRIEGKAYAFDNNYFNTNYLSHPGAGTLYYWVARTNHLGVGKSLGYAFAVSGVWEFFGEFRERVSLNDLFVTPLSGFALGEPLHQLSSFLAASCGGAWSTVGAVVFSPLGMTHDWIDGVRHKPRTPCDRYGMSSLGDHRIEGFLGGAVAHSAGRGGAKEHAAVSVASNVELLQVPTVGVAGHGWDSFSDGNLAFINLWLDMSGDVLTDLVVNSRTIPVGLHYRDLKGPRNAVTGQELLAGIGAGAEYSKHRYHGRDGVADYFYAVEAPALFLRWIGRMPGHRLELGLVAGGALAGVSAFAQEQYLTTGKLEDLTTVAQAHGYNHALGITVSPLFRWVTPFTSLSLTPRLDNVFVVRALDGDTENTSSVRVKEFRRRVRLQLSVGPQQGLQWMTTLQLHQRTGTANQATWHRAQLTLATGLGVRL